MRIGRDVIHGNYEISLFLHNGNVAVNHVKRKKSLGGQESKRKNLESTNHRRYVRHFLCLQVSRTLEFYDL